MITKTKAYSVGDKVYATLEAAQKAELEEIFNKIGKEIDREGRMNFDISDVVNGIYKNMDRIKDILGTTEDSRPRARKINRVKKKSISERTTEILDQAAVDGIRSQNALNQDRSLLQKT